ncbi:WbuC family cupin fold metalloprotein [Iodobacter fluviatilis]|uniref:Cupin fold metalloprotein, WbuC family n=1 Tax=Iodobacter fluviatilis TaxID=537 RepID=A0A7G3GD88_9NEIS|nr:WbuC family cupin fold metalloprotein [Iodobacter fluviatilis]QBC45022.1 cupin fold metalloprotein, WbuC family [Iodobacter fluviatilis]
MKQITPIQISQLADAAQASPRRRANLNMHAELADPIQRLAIAMEPDTLVRPHRHPHTWELLYPLAGRFLVLHFDEAGYVTDRCVLGTEAAVLETPAGVWHAVLSLDQGGVIFEMKHGPYMPIAAQDFAAWSPADGEELVPTLLAWYATAQVGDQFRLK